MSKGAEDKEEDEEALIRARCSVTDAMNTAITTWSVLQMCSAMLAVSMTTIVMIARRMTPMKKLMNMPT